MHEHAIYDHPLLHRVWWRPTGAYRDGPGDGGGDDAYHGERRT
jgi:hypothetical protein